MSIWAGVLLFVVFMVLLAVDWWVNLRESD